MSRFTGLSEIWFTGFRFTKIWAKYDMGSDAIALNFLKKLDSTDRSMWVLERLNF